MRCSHTNNKQDVTVWMCGRDMGGKGGGCGGGVHLKLLRVLHFFQLQFDSYGFWLGLGLPLTETMMEGKPAVVTLEELCIEAVNLILCTSNGSAVLRRFP